MENISFRHYLCFCLLLFFCNFQANLAKKSSLKELLGNLTGNKKFMKKWEEYWELNKRQQSWSLNFGFSYGTELDCNLTEVKKLSETVPNSVDTLLPSDFEVVAGLGDSWTSAAYADCKTTKCTLADASEPFEARGVAFSIGGNENLTNQTTLPNLLRYYRSNVLKMNLTGQSYGVANVSDEKLSQLNLAVEGAYSENLYTQAESLIQRLDFQNATDRISQKDLQNSWKLVTIFIGTEDLMNFCKNDNLTAENFVENINNTLELLYNNLNKTFVSVFCPMNLTFLLETYNTAAACKSLHGKLASCVQNTKTFVSTVASFEKKLHELISKQIYSRSDFAVVLQPFLETVHLVKFPVHANNTDLSIFSPDCLRFNRKGHSLLASGYWSSLLEPVGNKSSVFVPNWTKIKPKCVPEVCPFFRTANNSKNGTDCSTFIKERLNGEKRGGGSGGATVAPGVKPTKSPAGSKPSKGSGGGGVLVALVVAVLVVVVLVGFLGYRFFRRRRQQSDRFPLVEGTF